MAVDRAVAPILILRNSSVLKKIAYKWSCTISCEGYCEVERSKSGVMRVLYFRLFDRAFTPEKLSTEMTRISSGSNWECGQFQRSFPITLKSSMFPEWLPRFQRYPLLCDARFCPRGEWSTAERWNHPMSASSIFPPSTNSWCSMTLFGLP